MDTTVSFQPPLFVEESPSADHARLNGRSGAFGDNMSLPVHRWYRYSAGFSADWVRTVIRDRRAANEAFAVLDPFAGVGTTLLAADAERVKSWGFEAHPFIQRVARAKLKGIHCDLPLVSGLFEEFLARLQEATVHLSTRVPPLLAKCYVPESLETLLKMRTLFYRDFDAKTPQSELLWLTITSILRVCSAVGTAQWQYVLPNKTKSSVLEPIAAFQAKTREILQDISVVQHSEWANQSEILLTDARAPQGVADLQVDAVITSPPYPNNYDYADATRLEMTFWGEIQGWGDLQAMVRRHLIHSCSQHATAERIVLDDILAEPVLDPIRSDLARACHELAEVRQTKGGKKSYHTMAAAYFRDLGEVFKALRPLCRPNSFMCFVIGDSAPYGVYLDVDEWLGRMAVAAGFKSFTFEKIRDRNTKWKNRKHTVPLKEGRLWIEG